MGRRVAIIAAAAGAAVLAALTIAVVVVDGPLPGELAIIEWWQSLGQPVPWLAELVRATTSTEACLIAAAPAGVWIVRRHGRHAVPAILIALTSMLVVQPVSKELVDRDRPTTEQVDVRAEHTSRSYPSGHSLSTTTTWGAASLYAWRSRRRGVAALLAVPVILTGLSSSIQGVHWPSDALAGTIMGAFAARLIVRTLPVTSGVGHQAGVWHQM